jgi:hypothetical protein
VLLPDPKGRRRLWFRLIELRANTPSHSSLPVVLLFGASIIITLLSQYMPRSLSFVAFVFPLSAAAFVSSFSFLLLPHAAHLRFLWR